MGSYSAGKTLWRRPNSILLSCCIVVIVYCCTPIFANPSPQHPRLFLDEEKLGFIRNKASNGDPDFQNLINYANARMTQESLPDPWNSGAVCTGNKEGYRGSHYMERVMAFSLLYQTYKESDPVLANEYAQWGIKVLDEIVNDFTVTISGVNSSHHEGNEAVREFGTINSDEFEILSPFYAAHFDFPVTQAPNYKGGYAARNFGLAMAVGYDWLYDELSEEKRELYRHIMYRWVDWYLGRRTQFNTGANYDGTFYHEDRDGEDGQNDNSNINGPWGERPWRGYGLYMESGNFFGGYFLMHALTAFATYADDAFSQDYMDSFIESWTRLRQRLENEDDLAGGDLPEGWQYGAAYQDYIIQALLGISNSTDVFSSFAWPQQTLMSYIYATSPGLDTVHLHGEWTGSYTGLFDRGVLALSDFLRKQNNISAEYAQFHLNHASYVPQVRAHPWAKVMFYDPNANERPFSDFSRMYVSSGTGLVQARSSWSDPNNVVWWAIQAGSGYYGDHEAYDAGHLTITRGNDRLLLRTGSRFVENQNTVSFSDPGVTSINQDPYPDSIGERRTREETDLTYVYTDLSESFSQADHYSRQVVFFNPDVFFLFDKMDSKNGETLSKRCHLNFGPNTTIDLENKQIISFSGNSKLVIETIYPQAYTVENVNLGDAIRTALRSTNPQEVDYFLHVVLPMDLNVSDSVVSSLIETPEVIGAEINYRNQIYANVFCKNETLMNEVQFNLNFSGNKKIFVTGLSNSLFQISKDGQIIVDNIQSVENTIYFNDTGSGGGYLIIETEQTAGAIVIDHMCTDITLIPESAIIQAKNTLHIAYGHTSHGSQITTGMAGLVEFMNGLGYSYNLYDWNDGGTGGALDLEEGAEYETGWLERDCGNYPDWVNETREYLDDPS
ncbi:MAG: hypothetical protein Q8Q33_04740, partial [Chlamydiota bacterium]|nr:hypothetical protein [Chlamydiota bacterium]